MYTIEDIKKVLEDLEDKLSACSEIGLGDLSHSLGEAINLIEWLWEEYRKENK